MKSAATATIDLGALRHNLRVARECASASRLIAVVKADAYGHGLERVAKALEAADMLAVARCDEALRLRQAGIRGPVLVLEGFLQAEELALFSQHGFEAAVQHESQLAWLESARLERPIRLWVKLDTGMHRLGFDPDRLGAVLERLARCPAAAPAPRVMSHLANADDRDDAYTPVQLQRFVEATRGFEGERSLSNSAGVMGWPDCHFDWIRPGLMLYGCTPFNEGTGTSLGLRPVMTLETRIISLHCHEAGEPVGYGGLWRCPRKSLIGVAAVGYGDGYPRHAPSGTKVLVDGRPAYLAGRVSMDMIALDLTEYPNPRIGAPVELWGPRLPIEMLAASAATISYELLCRVTRRVVFQEAD